jgi:hypothetical protein
MKPRFELGENSLQFSRGIRYPIARPVEKIQVIDRTGSGSLQVEELGITIRSFPLVFIGLPLADYQALITWHNTIANGAANTFTYYDEEGTGHTVQMLTVKIDFQETDFQRFSGELLLEVVG